MARASGEVVMDMEALQGISIFTADGESVQFTDLWDQKNVSPILFFTETSQLFHECFFVHEPIPLLCEKRQGLQPIDMTECKVSVKCTKYFNCWDLRMVYGDRTEYRVCLLFTWMVEKKMFCNIC
jgi:hypothetical protein